MHNFKKVKGIESLEILIFNAVGWRLRDWKEKVRDVKTGEYDVRNQGKRRELILLTTFGDMRLGTTLIIILIHRTKGLAEVKTIVSDKTGLWCWSSSSNSNGISIRFYDSGN